MGRRVLEPVEDRQARPSAGDGTPEVVVVAPPLTRRSRRDAERQDAEHQDAERQDAERTPPRAVPAPGRRAAGAAAPGRPPSGRRAEPRRRPLTRPRRVASALVALGLVLAGLSLFGGSAAQADIVSSGRLALTPGAGQQIDSGMTFANGLGTAVFDLPAVPSGGGLYLGLKLRAGQAGSYVAKARVWADGHVTVGLSQDAAGRATRRLGDVRTDVVLKQPGRLSMEAAVVGQKPTYLAVRTWPTGQSRPAWQLIATDASSTPSAAGSFQTWGYLSSTASAAMSVPFSGLGAISADPAKATPTAPVTTSAPVTSSPPATSTTTTPATTKPSTSTSTPATTKPSTSTSTPPSAGGMPGAGNTGVPDGTKLTVHDGDLNADKAGATYDGLDIHGLVNVTAPNVTIRNSLIRGGSTSASRGVVQSTNAAVKNLVISDSEIRSEHPSNTLDGIDGGNFTLRRVEINGGVDNVHAFKDDVTIQDSWLHSSNYFSVGANAGGGASHNDGVQVMGGSNISITGSRIENADNAAIMVTQDAAPTVNLQVKGNWLNDGGCTVNIVPKKLASIGPIYLSGNVFGGTTRVANCPVVQTHSTTLLASNNVYAGSGQPVKINVWN